MKQLSLDKGHIRKVALQILKLRGFRVWPQNNVRAVRGRTFTGQKGVADIIGWQVNTGLLVFAEVKTLTDKLSTDQEELLGALHMSGGIALIATQKGTQVEIIEFVEYLKSKR